MKVYVNDIPFDMAPNMTVKHAIIRGGRLEEIKTSKRVYDQWGNELGLDGALSEGMRIYIK